MKIEKAELSQKIKKLKSVVLAKTNMPVLQGILVQDGYLIASNMELTIKAKTESACREAFIIPSKAFDLINNLPDGEVEIAACQDKEPHTILIETAKIKNRYQIMDHTLFPQTSMDSDGEEEFTIDGEVLLASMKRVSYAIATESPQPILKALYLHAVDGVLNFVGSDGLVMAWDKVPFSGEFKLLIPKSTVDKLIAIGISGNVSIRHNKTSAVFITDEYEVYTRVANGEYLKYNKIFKEFQLHTVVSRVDMIDAMTRAKTCTEERCPVKFVLEGNLLKLSIKDSLTDYDETLDLQEEIAEPLTIAFNVRLVLETLKAFECDNIGFSFESSKMPMIIEAEDSDFKSLVLPVAIN